MSGDRLKKVIHGGKIRKVRRETGAGVLDFSASINPVPPPLYPDLSWDILTCYPDDTYATLREAISRISGRPPEEIAVGNGSIEIIRLFCSSTLRPGDRVNIRNPTFGEYELSAGLAGGVPGGPADSKVSFLCNPNNPTGILTSREEVLARAEKCGEQDSLLFVDEAFIELADDPSQSVADVRSLSLFVVRSITKSFGVPGVRFGYGFGDPALIEKMDLLRPPWNINAFAESIALEAFRHYDELSRSREFIRAEREHICSRLSDLPVEVTPSQTNFLLLTLRNDASPLCEDLLKEGILVRDCHSFGLPCSIRIAVRTRSENNMLLEALRKCLP